MARIGFCGSMSVGKSTLVKELAKVPYFQEYNIFTEKSKEIRDKGVLLNTDSTLLGQSIFASYRAEELLQENMLTDRTIIDVICFTNLASSISKLTKLNFEILYTELIKSYDYIFYISPEGVEIEDNSVRTTDSEYRNQIDKEIKDIIRGYKSYIKNYTELTGSTTDRIKKVMEVLSSPQD